MSRHPDVKWAQRPDKVYITVELPDSRDAKVNLQPQGILTFSANGGLENHLYQLKLELFDMVNVEESMINIGRRSIICVVEKKENKWWDKLLRGDGKTPHYVKVDWDKWVDEDDDVEDDKGANDLDFGGLDFSKLGGFVGNDDDDEDEVSESESEDTTEDEDDEDQQNDDAKKAEENMI